MERHLSLDEESEIESVSIMIAVVAKVTPEQVSQALQNALDEDGDLIDFDITGTLTLDDGSVAVMAEVQVESGMAAMEWQRDLASGAVEVEVRLRATDAHALARPNTRFRD